LLSEKKRKQWFLSFPEKKETPRYLSLEKTFFF